MGAVSNHVANPSRRTLTRAPQDEVNRWRQVSTYSSFSTSRSVGNSFIHSSAIAIVPTPPSTAAGIDAEQRGGDAAFELAELV